MKYDFDQVVSRVGTGCNKWDGTKTVFGRTDLLPMWIADMDFGSPLPVVEAIQKRASHPIYGYAYPPESLYEAVIEKLHRDHQWKVDREWLVVIEGIVGGISNAIKSLTAPGDNVVLQPPVYFPFFNAIVDNGCQVNENPLIYENGRYTINFEHLEQQFNARTKALLLCSPHNPVGRVWRKSELEKVALLCQQKGVVMIADEIHNDLVYSSHQHTPLASLSDEVAQNTITFISPGKTFNIAGLTTSVAIIPNKRLRDNFISARIRNNSGNLFGYVAMEAAYRDGGEYLEALLPYIRNNMDHFIDYLKTHCPKIKVVDPEGTYLLWVDFSGLGLAPDELRHFLIEECRLGLNDGRLFGSGGTGFQRFNLGCPRSYVTEALERLKRGYDVLLGRKEIKK